MAKKVNLPDLLLGITFQRLKIYRQIHLRMVNLEKNVIQPHEGNPS